MKLFFAGLLFCITVCIGCSKPQRQPDDLRIIGKARKVEKAEKKETQQRKTPFTPTALCHDDKYTFNRNVEFACYGHGGVKDWTYDSDIEIKEPPYYED